SANTCDRGEFVAIAVNHRRIFGFQIPGDVSPTRSTAVADIMNVQIEMIAPEEWRRRERLACAENVARGCLTLTLRHYPVLDTYAARARIWPAGDIAGGKNSRHVRLQIFVDQKSVIRRNPRLFRERGVWPNADTNNHEVAIQNRSVIESHVSVLYDCRRSPQVKLYAVRLVSLVNHLAQFGSKNFLQRQRSFSDNCDFEFALAQRCCDFQADEARADHDRALRVFRFFDDAAAVSESAQIANVRQIVPGNREPNWLCAGGQQQRAIS